MAKTVKIDEKGRLVIPKELRERTQLKEGGYVKVSAEEEGILIKPLEPIADKYFGAFKIVKWPKDLDEFAVEVIKEWWSSQDT